MLVLLFVIRYLAHIYLLKLDEKWTLERQLREVPILGSLGLYISLSEGELQYSNFEVKEPEHEKTQVGI